MHFCTQIKLTVIHMNYRENRLLVKVKAKQKQSMYTFIYDGQEGGRTQSQSNPSPPLAPTAVRTESPELSGTL